MKRTLIAVGLVSGIGLLASQAAAAAVHYAVLGDTPYGSAQFESFARTWAQPRVGRSISTALFE